MNQHMQEFDPKELIVIKDDDRLKTFTTEGAIEPILALVRQRIDAFEGDVSTPKGRAEIKSFAHNIAKSKTYLEGSGKELADEQKSIPKKIDACRKHIKDTLDAWRDEVRQPLDNWEAVEEARMKLHSDNIGHMNFLTSPTNEIGQPYDAVTLRQRLKWVEEVEIGPHCEEYEDEYVRAKNIAIEQLKITIASREQFERDQAELAELRRQRAEREAAEKAAADAQAVREAEERRQQKEDERIRLAAEKAAQDERDRAAREARDAEARAQAEREAAARREDELRRQAEEAERRAAETESRIAREAEEARQREADELARRERDKNHKAKINREAVAAFVVGGLTEECAKTAVTLIAKKLIQHIQINY